MAVAPVGLASARGKPSSADPVAATMAGEFALQAGKLDEAARWYLDAARASSADAGLAERATRIALLANDDADAAAGLSLWRQRAPNALSMRAAQATLSLHRHEASAARAQLEGLLRERGADGWHFALAALAGARDPALAAQVLAQLVDSGAIPDQLQAWLAFGEVAQKLEQPPLAARIVDLVVAKFPDEPRVALLHAAQLREAGKSDAARVVLAKLAAAVHQDVDIRLAVAAQYDALGDPQSAAATLARGPQDNQSEALRASLLAKAHDMPGLEALYAGLKSASNDPDPERRLLLGQTAEFLKRMDEALKWYQSVPGGPQRWQARLHAASVLQSLKRGGEAYAGLRAMQTDATVDDDARREAYLTEADLRGKDHDPAGEMDAYARGLAAFPDDPALLYARALSWEQRDDIARTEADLRKVLALEPDNVAALNALGYTLADRTSRYREALELIDRARVAEPDNPAITDSYGWILFRLGRRSEALIELRRAYAQQKDPEIAAHLAEVLWTLGDKGQSRRYFDEARKLEPGNRSLQRALQRTGA